MKMVYELQLSNIEKKNKLFVISADSNYTFAINLLKKLRQMFPIKIDVLLPAEKQCADYEQVVSELKSYNLNPVETNLYLNHPALSRFFVSKEISQYADADILFLNDPAHVANWKQVARDVKIITYNHWICQFDKNVVPYFFRQVEGYYNADLVLTDSYAAKLLILRQLALLDFTLTGKITPKIKVLEPSVDIDLLDGYTFKPEFDNVILFNHRLSSFEEYQVNLKNFIKVLKSISKYFKKDALSIIFTNPSGYAINKLEEVSFKHQVKTLDRQSYIKLLKTRPITCAFFEHPRIWSIALAEANMFGSASVVPNHSAFLEMYPWSYPKFTNLDEAKEMLTKLLMDIEYRIKLSKAASKHQIENFSNVVIAKKLWNYIQKLQ